MLERRVDDEMIEIGDPYEESIAPEPPPKVVIEYRERGIPWMLLPPLLVICAVAAVVGYSKFSYIFPNRFMAAKPNPVVAPKAIPDRLRAAADLTQTGSEKILTNDDLENYAKNPVRDTPPADDPAGAPTSIENEAAPIAAEKPSDPVTLPPPATLDPAPQTPPATELAKPAEPDKTAEPSTFPKATGVGFDPKAFETERKAEPAAPDPSLTPAVREDPPREPAKPAMVDEKDLPREVDPDLLPPDPRQARARQRVRVDEKLKEVEVERTRFHNDLRELCRIRRENYLAEVLELSQRYGLQVDPKIKKMVGQLFGVGGQFAGVDRPTRIDVLRAVGFPETLILEDVYEKYEAKRIGERNGPRNESEAMYKAMLFLLRYPPGRPAAVNRAARATSVPPPPAPAFLPNPSSR